MRTFTRAHARPHLLIAAAALALAGLGLAGCSSPQGGGDAGSVAIEPAPAPDMAVTDESSAGMRADSKSVASADREIIKSAWMSVRVEDVAESATRVGELAAARGGETLSQERYTDGTNGYANVTVKVPADALDAFLNDIRALGTVDNESVSSMDVTVQGADLDARINALTASVNRLQELLEQAENVADLVAIESELATRQAELDGLQAQRRELSSQVAMSSVTVNLAPIVAGPSAEPPGFVVGLQRGWQAMLSAFAWAITTAGFALPFIAIALVVAAVVAAVVVPVSRRRRDRADAGDGPQSEEGSS